MLSTMVLLLGSLATGSGDSWPSIACNKQGTAFDSVWITGSGSSAAVVYQRNGVGSGTAVPTYPNSGPPNQPGTGLACTVDTDDSSAKNYAVVWTAQDNTLNQSMAYCSVNGHSPFRVGYDSSAGVWRSAGIACVAIMRQPLASGNVVVSVSFLGALGGSPVYSQAFQVSPSTGAVAAQSNPVAMNKSPGGSLYLGGSSGDDNGNFVVTYSRWQDQEGSTLPTGVFVSGYKYSSLPTLTFQEVTVTSAGDNTLDYLDSRVACYHNGGFVVAWNGGLEPINVLRFTATGSLVSTTPLQINNYPMPDQSEEMEYWDYRIACPRDTPGDYIVTLATSDGYGSGGSYGVVNTVFAWISGDSLQSVTFVTTHSGYGGGISDVPCVAISDSSYGLHYQIDYLNNSNGGTIADATGSSP